MSPGKFSVTAIEMQGCYPHVIHMTQHTEEMIDITPGAKAASLDPEAMDEIAALAARQRAADGLLMKAVTYVGSHVESGLRALPKPAQVQIERTVRAGLEKSFHLAGHTRIGRLEQVVGADRLNKTMATVTGAVGGVAGLSSALAELPLAITIIFRAVQGVAEHYGEDPTSEETRLACLAVFGKGGPSDDDDGIDTAFIGAKLSLTGPALQKMIATISPRFATLLSQKLASQSVPVLGALAGAGTNYAFVDYYVEMAHVHFGLRALSAKFGEALVTEEFHRVLAADTVPVNRA